MFGTKILFLRKAQKALFMKLRKKGLIVVITIILLKTSLVFAQPSHYGFSHITINQGLSNNQVTCIIKDRKGFLWFGTGRGLSRYDGYSFKIFKHNPSDTSTLVDNFINSLTEDADGRIWVKTRTGINIYDPKSDQIHRNQTSILKQYGIRDPNIVDIIKGRDGMYWFVSEKKGFFAYSSQKKSVRYIAHRSNDSTSIHESPISTLAEDSKGNLWILYFDGVLQKVSSSTFKVTYQNNFLQKNLKRSKFYFSLYIDNDDDLWIHDSDASGVFNFKTGSQEFVALNTVSNPIRLNSNIIRRIVQDSKGLIWVATDHGGINIIDKKKESVQYLLNNVDNAKSLSQNSINSMYKDDDGIIWIGTFKKGINYYHEDIFRFAHYKHFASDPTSLPFDDINKFIEDEQGNIWIATNGGGLLYFNREENTFKQYRHSPLNSSSLSNDVIVGLAMDGNKNLWIGTYFGGLDKFDGKSFLHYKHDANNSKSIADDRIWEILEDSKKNLWIGTFDKGLDIFNRDKNEFIHYRNGDINSIQSQFISSLIEDKDKNIWIGTAYGLDILNLESGRFIHYGHDSKNSNALSHNNVTSLLEDSRGLVWIGTREGLNYFNKDTRKFSVLTKESGLPDNAVVAILEDDNHNLWVSTPNGLSNIVIEQKATPELKFTFRNFDEHDGLQGNEFNSGSAYKTRYGELMFGGANGFNIFKPGDVKLNLKIPAIIISDFQIFTKSIHVHEKMNGRVILNQSIIDTKEVVLNDNENMLTFEFAALNYLHPEKNNYAYIMEGFNREWLKTDGLNRRATYTNLDPGTYVFRVKASNNDGIWNEKGTSIRIIILPPFWKSKWAYAFYVAFIAVFILTVFFLYKQLVIAPERLTLRLEQERIESERKHELDLLKIKFFTNVSHEFRTPLTLILTPLENILKNLENGNLRNQLELVHRNARRLLNLVNQLLDFRRIEMQEFKLNSSEGDIISCIRETAYSFSDLSEHKSINFTFHASVAVLETFFDQDKLEKILFNLLSNAFKFTPEGGSVSVEIALGYYDHEKQTDLKRLEIKVKDSGIGIPTDKLELIFERFFQNEMPKNIINQGSGIGLAITKEFVRLHSGTITADSEVGNGSVFTVYLPIAEITSLTSTYDLSHEEIQAVNQLNKDSVTFDNKKPLLLLVEDNEDFRFYLKDNLKQTYHVAEAKNGNEGWRQAFTLIPDLIVSDIMMPEMDGIQLCKKIKKDTRTSHIPVILLTARSAEEQKIEGYDIGASDYVTKPFNFEILQSRIRNLILQEEHGRKVRRKQIDISPSKMEITSLDQKLIQKAVKLVENNISKSEFSVKDLSHELGMSRVNLYKKLMALTGKSPIEFIRVIRLKRAAQLLKESQLNISEIAYQLGFNNPRYFTQYFKEEYGVLPSEYLTKQKDK